MEDLEGEIWKPIIYKGVDYTGRYEVSNMGRVKSLVRNKLIGSLNDDGYKRVLLCKNGNQKTIKIHSLVAHFFIGKINNKVIDHINSDKTDNRCVNLRIVSIRANCSKEKVIKSGTPCGVSKIKNRQLYLSSISFKSKSYVLGHYKCVYLAAAIYNIALHFHNKGSDLKTITKEVDNYRILIGLKPIKRRVKN